MTTPSDGGRTERRVRQRRAEPYCSTDDSNEHPELRYLVDRRQPSAAQPATDEKGRPMTYWGGLAAPTVAAPTQPPVSAESPTPRTRPVVIHVDDEMGGLECVGLSDYEKLETELAAAKAELERRSKLATPTDFMIEQRNYWKIKAEKAEQSLAALQKKVYMSEQVANCIGRQYETCDKDRIYFRDELKALQARIEEAGKELPPKPELSVLEVGGFMVRVPTGSTMGFSSDLHVISYSRFEELETYADTLRQQYTDLLAKSKGE